MKQRNTDIDWIRAILIILMILIHIVSFGNAYPQLKAGILSFMMPTFLIITGYLVNIEKSPKEMGRYLMCLALPYVIMVTGFSVLSYFMPVRDGITELSLSQICEKIFVTSIGPYWFIQTMIICGILYYVSFKGATWGAIRQGKTTMSTTTSLFIFAIVFSCWCCISSLMWIHSLINHLQDNVSVRKTEDTLLYMGRNTLPIYLFHPIFTMAAKFYHPLFNWDRSEICFALVTIFIAIAGSIGIAKMMEKTHLAYLFGKGKMLR